MQRPSHYRPATWAFVIARLGNAAIQHVYDPQRPGKVALSSGILEHPDLLENTVIEIDGNVCLIDRAAADQIKHRGPEIVLKYLRSQETITVSVEQVNEAIQQGAAFDQLPL